MPVLVVSKSTTQYIESNESAVPCIEAVQWVLYCKSFSLSFIVGLRLPYSLGESRETAPLRGDEEMGTAGGVGTHFRKKLLLLLLLLLLLGGILLQRSSAELLLVFVPKLCVLGIIRCVCFKSALRTGDAR
ncbi:hypothetical protein N656DRAFT_63519 [Canariomyces notabilis]|uniref:Uncharacterized protein n=1 Tax=Canariomyces notabilis TaxID=2074819 RepID=A0AAN6YYV7_9PEZI|nr:hypothetical protein N656DRAFT_63519 [Canariomyces arenarius]